MILPHNSRRQNGQMNDTGKEGIVWIFVIPKGEGSYLFSLAGGKLRQQAGKPLLEAHAAIFYTCEHDG